MKNRKHYQLIVNSSEDNQGIRFYAMKKAYELGLYGNVSWENQTQLIINIEGSPDQINPFLDWFENEPPEMHIIELVINELPLENYHSFEMK